MKKIKNAELKIPSVATMEEMAKFLKTHCLYTDYWLSLMTVKDLVSAYNAHKKIHNEDMEAATDKAMKRIFCL